MSPRRHRGLSSRLSNAGAASRATRVCVASLFAAAGLLVAIGAASAAPSTEAGKKAARPHYEKGASEYNLGHFAESISEFEKAYEQDPAPILLFNIAQAHRQSGNNERAAFFYRRYLEQEPSAANRAEVEKRIKDLEGVIQQQNDVKRRPPTEVTDQDQRAAATPPAATTGSPPSTSNAFPPPPPQGTAASALPPPITPSSPAPEVSVNAGMTNVVPESAHPIKVWVSAGPAFPSFSGRDLQEPTLFSLRLGVAYAIDLHNAGFLDVGLSGAYAPFQYRTLDTDANRSAAFWGVLASAKYRYRLAPSFDIAGEVGGGVVWWSGLADQNPFTTDAVAATGAVPMPSLLLGVGAIYHLSTHVSLFAQPTFLLSKTTGDGLSSAISSVSRIDLAFGLGFSI